MKADTERGPVGEMVLMFGCRHPDWDDLYAQDFAAHETAGRLQVHRAYSRQPEGEVRYVQHRLWQHREKEWALAGAAGEHHGEPSWLDDLARDGRYSTDLF